MKFYNQFLGLICSVFNAYSGVLFLKDPNREGWYRLAGCFSLGDNRFTELLICKGKGVISWIIKNERPLLITNFEKREDNILDYYVNGDMSDIKSLIGCPLDNKMGAICVDSKNKFSFTEKDQKILHQFSQVLSSLNNKLFEYHRFKKEHNFYNCIQKIEDLKRHYQKWNSFLKRFLETVANSTGFKYCFFATRDKDGQGYYIEDWNNSFFPNKDLYVQKKYKMDIGIIGWVFKKGKTFIKDKIKDKGRKNIVLFDKTVKTHPFQCLICLPVYIYLKVRGVLVLADDKPHQISNEEKKFLLTVANQLSLFLENLYLKNRLQKQLRS